MRKIKITEATMRKIISESVKKVLCEAENSTSDEIQAKIKEMEAKGYPADGSEYWPDDVIPVRAAAFCKLKTVKAKETVGDYKAYEYPYDDGLEDRIVDKIVVDETAPITICCYQGNSPATIEYGEISGFHGWHFGCIGRFKNLKFDDEPFFTKQIPYNSYFNNKANEWFIYKVEHNKEYYQAPNGFKNVGETMFLVHDDRVELEDSTKFEIDMAGGELYETCWYDPRSDGNDFTKTLDEYLK